MRLYGKKFYLKKKLSYGSQKNSEKNISKLNIKLIFCLYGLPKSFDLLIVFFFIRLPNIRTHLFKLLSKRSVIN